MTGCKLNSFAGPSRRNDRKPPNHASACLGVMLVNCQLSGGADTSQEGRPRSTRSVNALSASCGRVQGGSLRLPAWKTRIIRRSVSEKILSFSRTLPRQFRRKTWCWIIFKISMNAISISVRLRIFSNFFKKSRALPEVFYARRWPEVSRLCPSAVT